MSGDYFGYEGEIFNIPPIKLCPTPSQTVPIIIGGHSEAALKRAASAGDGWVCAGAPIEQIDSMIRRINQLRSEYGRDKLDFEFHTNSEHAFSTDGIKRLEDIGVTDLTVAYRNIYESQPDTQSVAEKSAALDWYAEKVIAKL